jgi:hypothetical protein
MGRGLVDQWVEGWSKVLVIPLVEILLVNQWLKILLTIGRGLTNNGLVVFSAHGLVLLNPMGRGFADERAEILPTNG